jgi:hypothetical protein
MPGEADVPNLWTSVENSRLHPKDVYVPVGVVDGLKFAVHAGRRDPRRVVDIQYLTRRNPGRIVCRLVWQISSSVQSLRDRLIQTGRTSTPRALASPTIWAGA